MSKLQTMRDEYDKIAERHKGDTTGFTTAIRAYGDYLRPRSNYLYTKWRLIVRDKLGIVKEEIKAKQDKGAVLFNGGAR